MPNHQYAHLTEQWLLICPPAPIDKNLQHIMKSCAVSTQAYSHVVLRLQAQAEAAEAEYIANIYWWPLQVTVQIPLTK